MLPSAPTNQPTVIAPSRLADSESPSAWQAPNAGSCARTAAATWLGLSQGNTGPVRGSDARTGAARSARAGLRSALRASSRGRALAERVSSLLVETATSAERAGVGAD